MKFVAIGVLLIAALAVSGCNRSGGERRPALNLRGAPVPPDEFLVLPQKPLEMPAESASLPAPVPGAANRVEIDFQGNMIAALGGRTAGNSGVPAEDAALVAAARAGSEGTENIRSILAAEDRAYREERARRIAKLAEDNNAAAIYDRALLDANAELARLRALGVKVPIAPPR